MNDRQQPLRYDMAPVCGVLSEKEATERRRSARAPNLALKDAQCVRNGRVRPYPSYGISKTTILPSTCSLPFSTSSVRDPTTTTSASIAELVPTLKPRPRRSILRLELPTLGDTSVHDSLPRTQRGTCTSNSCTLSGPNSFSSVVWSSARGGMGGPL